MSKEQEQETKEPKVAVRVTIDGGVVNVDDPTATQAEINNQILQALAALKERSVTSAKLKLIFSASTTV